MKKIIILLFLFLGINQVFAGRIRDIEIKIDSTNFGIKNTFGLTIYLVKKSGKRIELSPNEFSLYWNKINVKGAHITSFKHGIVTFDQASIYKENNSCELTVSYNEGEHSVLEPIKLPFVTELIIKNTFISVNHSGPLDYDLIFSNGKTSPASSNLFNDQNFINASPIEVNLNGSLLMMELTEPVSYETVELSLKNKLDNHLLGKKTLIIEYPTTCRIDFHGKNGNNGTNGKDGQKYSENGNPGTNGENGTSGINVKVFAKMTTINQSKFLILQAFSSNGKHISEVIKFDGNTIKISTEGGIGGNGGNGGNGMKGYINKDKQINTPNGGNGGNGGNAGSGGNGGNINFIFANSSGDLSSFFTTFSNGGKAGLVGTGGKGAKGDYSDLPSAGKTPTTRDGKAGNIGINNTDGSNGIIYSPHILSDEDWKIEYLKSLNQGF